MTMLNISNLNVIGNFSIVNGDLQLALSGLGRVNPELARLANHAVASLGYSD